MDGSRFAGRLERISGSVWERWSAFMNDPLQQKMGRKHFEIGTIREELGCTLEEAKIIYESQHSEKDDLVTEEDLRAGEAVH